MVPTHLDKIEAAIPGKVHKSYDTSQPNREAFSRAYKHLAPEILKEAGLEDGTWYFRIFKPGADSAIPNANGYASFMIPNTSSNSFALSQDYANCGALHMHSCYYLGKEQAEPVTKLLRSIMARTGHNIVQLSCRKATAQALHEADPKGWRIGRTVRSARDGEHSIYYMTFLSQPSHERKIMFED